VDQLYTFPAVTTGLDEEGKVARLVAEARSIGVEEVSKNILELIVVAVPFTDRDAMADNFGIKKGDLKPDTMVAGKGKNYGAHFYARGNHVYFGNNATAVSSVAKGKRIGSSLTAE